MYHTQVKLRLRHAAAVTCFSHYTYGECTLEFLKCPPPLTHREDLYSREELSPQVTAKCPNGWTERSENFWNQAPPKKPSMFLEQTLPLTLPLFQLPLFISSTFVPFIMQRLSLFFYISIAIKFLLNVSRVFCVTYIIPSIGSWARTGDKI